MYVKTLSGELIQVESVEDYVARYVTNPYFTKVLLLDDAEVRSILVNEYPMMTIFDPDTFSPRMWEKISLCPHAIELLKEYPDKINWEALSNNPAATDLLRENLDKVSLSSLSSTSLVDLVPLESIAWEDVAQNTDPKAITLMRQHLDRVCWSVLCTNPCPEAIELIRENLDRVDWTELSTNEGAVDLLLDNPERIVWRLAVYNKRCSVLFNAFPEQIESVSSYELSENPDAVHIRGMTFDFDGLSANPNAIAILRENIDKINWVRLSDNINAGEFFTEENADKLDFTMLSKNPSAIELLKKFPERINWFWLCHNTGAADLIYHHPDRITTNWVVMNKCVYCLKESN
jgi:hypothetical protein